jgi:hypothetical protein
MDDVIRVKLRDRLTRSDRITLLGDSRALAEVVRENLGPECKREAGYLNTVMKAGVPTRLLGMSAASLNKTMVVNYAKQISHDTGLREDIARWAIDAWAFGLGLQIVDSAPALGADDEQRRPHEVPLGRPSRRTLVIGGGVVGAGALGLFAILKERTGVSEGTGGPIKKPAPVSAPPSAPPPAPKDPLIRTFTGHTGGVNAAAVAPHGETALSGSEDKTLKLWKLATGDEICSFTEHTSAVTSVAFTPDGKTMLSGCYNGTLKLWNLEILHHMFPTWNTAIRTWDTAGIVYAVAIAPDGRTALSGGDDWTLQRWDLASGNAITNFGGFLPNNLPKTVADDYPFLLGNAVLSVVIAPDGRTSLSGYQNGLLILWDLATSTVVRTFVHHSSVTSVAIARGGRTALSGSGDHTLKLWDLASGNLIRTFTGHTESVNAVAIAPDGRTVLSGSDDKTLKLWDLASGNTIRTFTGHTGRVNAAAIAPDGKTALSGSEDKTLKLWDLT